MSWRSIRGDNAAQLHEAWRQAEAELTAADVRPFAELPPCGDGYELSAKSSALINRGDVNGSLSRLPTSAETGVKTMKDHPVESLMQCCKVPLGLQKNSWSEERAESWRTRCPSRHRSNCSQ